MKLSEEQQVSIYTYENANHSLETKDTIENLKILQDVMAKTNDKYSINIVQKVSRNCFLTLFESLAILDIR